MKLGIITYANTTDNYGQVMQCLATLEYLRRRGHECYTLRQVVKQSLAVRVKSFIFYIARECFPWLRTEQGRIVSKWKKLSAQNEKMYPRRFEEFRERYFKLIDGTIEDLANICFDGYVSASDQIWGSPSFWYMLGWTPSDAKRIAIAPSVGLGIYNEEQIQVAKTYLSRFDFITVRESNGVDLCNRCGVKGLLILDPTFLLAKEDYMKFVPAKIVESGKPYILVYLVGAKIDISLSKIIHFAEQYNLDIKYIESQGRSEDYNDKIYAEIPDWLSLINGAEYIITNSFHGMAFSIIFRKRFMVIPLSGTMSSMNLRLYDLAKATSLQSRIYNGNLTALFDPINWSVTEKVISNNRDLVNALMDTIE